MTQDEMIEMARQAGLKDTKAMFRTVYVGNMADLKRFANLVAEHEREARAQVCEDSVEYAGDTLAEAIRERGQA